jgi:hypothetical protein
LERADDHQVCENAQSLRVIHSMQICTLCKFDPPVMQKRASN